MTRRTLLGTLLTSLAALIAIGVAGILDPPVESRAAIDVPYDLDGPTIQQFSVYDLDGWLVLQPDGSVRAFSSADPRRGCPVEFVGPEHRWYLSRRNDNNQEWPSTPGYFYEPCGGSRWSLDGLHTFGPSWRGLDSFEVRDIRRGFITLDLSRMMLGTCGAGIDKACSQPGAPEFVRPRAVARP